MPYIAPNTKVYILKGIPLDNTYEHTVAYPDADTQLTEFLKYKKFELEKLSYQRVGAGLMRVELKYEQMYDCNYMIFQNTSYGNKWWYAFITGVAYVNNSVCTISYEIDVMQTWCFDYAFMPSFVDREHVDPGTESFTNYKNYIQPEGLETGSEPIRIYKQECGGEVKAVLLLATTTETGNNRDYPLVTNNNVSSLYSRIWNVGENFTNTAQVNDMNNVIHNFVNNGFGDNIMSLTGGPSPTVNKDVHRTGIKDCYSRNGNINGYSPKNPKLMCYPFHYYIMNDKEGHDVVLRPELVTYEWNDADIMVEVVSYTFPQALSVMYPINYNTTQLYTGGDWNEDSMIHGLAYALYISDYPTFAIANDSYKAWWAQNKNSYLATQGNIGRTYNTEMANIGNSYAQQMVGLNNTFNNNRMSANAQYDNANRSNQTALSNANTSAMAQRATGLISGVSGALGSLGNLTGEEGIGGVFSGVMGGVATVMNANINADVTRQNAQATADTNAYNTAQNFVLANSINANNLSSGKQIAELAKQSASLSALTNNQNAIASLVAKKQDMLNAPDNAIGAITGSPLRNDTNNYGFCLYEVCIQSEFLRMADSYFEKYGYKVATMKTPSKMNNRPYWHYLQTAGCNIKGNFNDTDISAIKTIYNNGITTWNSLDNVGDYSLDNH